MLVMRSGEDEVQSQQHTNRRIKHRKQKERKAGKPKPHLLVLLGLLELDCVVNLQRSKKRTNAKTKCVREWVSAFAAGQRMKMGKVESMILQSLVFLFLP